MEGKIPMSVRRRVTNKLRTTSRQASKKDRGRILDEVMALKGISATTPSPLSRNSISISKAGDEPPTVPGVVEADTVAHFGPTLKGEFCRTLTMTDLVTGWTENASTRNNASKTPGFSPINRSTDQQITVISTRIENINPADLTRNINHIQQQLTELSKAKTPAMTAARRLDMATSEPSIRRLQTTT
jgi:hypothetical protein